MNKDNDVYIDIYENMSKDVCMCLLNEKENNGIAKIQICCSEKQMLELVYMCNAKKTVDDNDIITYMANVEFQITHDKMRPE